MLNKRASVRDTCPRTPLTSATQEPSETIGVTEDEPDMLKVRVAKDSISQGTKGDGGSSVEYVCCHRPRL